MKLRKGNLILTRGVQSFNLSKHYISVVLDEDCGASNCHIRNIYRLDHTQFLQTMNWSNIKRDTVIAVLGYIGDEDYTKDFIDISDKDAMIRAQLQELIPEYML